MSDRSNIELRAIAVCILVEHGYANKPISVKALADTVIRRLLLDASNPFCFLRVISLIWWSNRFLVMNKENGLLAKVVVNRG